MIVQSLIVGAMMLQGAPAAEPLAPTPIALIESQEDPAALLNLGVKLAEQGETEAARRAFEKVRSMRIDYTLETTDGRYVYPADLARDGLRMLDRGEFAQRRDKVATR
ncbi:hypothetical protein AAG614_02470 [Citromicrobium bathyomarinum]|jgi:hypothetical protein|uniref:hypothetical protein n=1 Tax=Sphingomonadales TaxID=204457 RepID=UPI0006C8EB82|nr:MULTISPECIES: hypothetical protein [Sphingomonadales]MAO05559.1 hypothetical protein [Citromicrobium sp.]KPM25653.1 hypothetical protein AAJ72_08500 [Citromicrobium sp. RCC1885]KPM28895.1 hypothetical protein AAJ74_09240 [Citromicrobium sp. RCC1878]MAY77668.1 hypothetical protein [Citromicrobium sp.]MBH1944481.1 hypothetical protein [Erythrobacter sp. YJ-T3-07]|tara:strand:- start:2563 stop:2886 length:324 start_codon:yes stop_codon:yes gene_type:complete